ncbi:MAG: phosphatase PAP2 family protein [Oscillospiraceae bacterium]|nr:phosphatase PAP2 family protein [Oscillospiraceae bacterium]
MELTAIAAWLNSSCAGLDAAVTSAVAQLYDIAGGFFTPFAHFMDLMGKGGAILIAISLALILFPKTRKVGTVMLLALGIGALLTNVVFKPLVYRPRPYSHEGSVYHQLWLLVGQHTESDFSFPSGHTTAATAAMLGIFFTCPKKKSWVALIFAVAMGFSRIYLGVHYFTDILGGFVAGTIGAVAAYYIGKALPEVYYNYVFKFLRRE